MANIAIPIAALAIGVLLAIAGAIVGWVVVPNIIDDKIKEVHEKLFCKKKQHFVSVPNILC